MQTLSDGAKQAWRDGKVKRFYHVIAHQVFEFGPTALTLGINCHIVHLRQKRVDLLLCAVVLLGKLMDGGAYQITEFGGAEIRSCSANDTGVGRHLTCAESTIKTRQNLAPRQITCATKNHQIEIVDRNNA
jgi:hypothetical protein